MWHLYFFNGDPAGDLSPFLAGVTTTLTFLGDGTAAAFSGDDSLSAGDAVSLLIFTGAGISTFFALAILQTMAC